ncbi:MAG TPA: FAD-dependent monooxygenase [Trebonia sp.]
MQFHQNGFRVGDPGVLPSAAGAGPPAGLPDTVDVLIVGCGPAGLVLAAQLAVFPEIRIRIVERRGGPLEFGQADGVACRTVEMFEAFGLSDRLLREGYWVNETVFWGPDEADRSRIVRTGRIQDVEDDLSEFPHLILNQARIHQHLLDKMRNSASRLVPDYGLEVVDVEVGDGEYPVLVTLSRAGAGADGGTGLVRVRARYVVGCDGARSRVREATGQKLEGDSANQAWGVMDVLAVTDFPDIRFKAAIKSTSGNIIVLPREGGYLVRCYIELGELEPGERAGSRNLTFDSLLETARRIIHPYTIDVREVAWWSVYEIGQRLAARFDDAAPGSGREPRVFIAGDACHTHSPKAGQGMNVSMQDAFNLGWKLAAVLRGRSGPELLRTYSAERQAVAQDLIDFDREWARMMSAPPKDPADPASTGVEPEEFRRRFAAGGRYTAGVATRYTPSAITGTAVNQQLATGLGVGERFHSAPVVRLADGRPMQLGHAAQADGRWRIYLFCDPAGLQSGSKAARALDYLADDPRSPVVRCTPAGADVDAVIDVRVVVDAGHRDVRLETWPALALPRTGALGLIDYEKAFCVDPGPGRDIYALRGIDRAAGCLVVVRPDQYVASVLPLDALDEVGTFFAAFMRPARHEAVLGKG